MTQVFVSYSRRDAVWLKLLKIHLKPLVRDGLDLWDDTRIEAGQQWKKEIEQALSSARVAVLLISPNFLASDFIHSQELPRLLEAAGAMGTTILCLIVAPCLFEEMPALSQFQAINQPDRPLLKMTKSERAECLVRLAKRIKDVFAEEERQAREKAEAEQARVKAEAERQAREKAEMERQARVKVEAERQARERVEKQRFKEEKEHQARVKSLQRRQKFKTHVTKLLLPFVLVIVAATAVGMSFRSLWTGNPTSSNGYAELDSQSNADAGSSFPPVDPPPAAEVAAFTFYTSRKRPRKSEEELVAAAGV